MKAGDIIANRYELVSKLGSGGFGAVWKAIDRVAGHLEVAIKIYAHETGLDDSALSQFQKEYTLVMDLHHPNLLTSKHFDIWENRPFLIFPLMPGGSLYQKIINSNGLSESDIALVLYQVADGLHYLHDNDVIHQDVKPDNVLIDAKGRYLLTDFGISSRMRSTLRRATGVQNSKTISFAPPERFGSNQQIVPEGDIFSLGVMVYEMATTTLPWMGMGGMHLMPQSELPSLPENYSSGLNALLSSMLNYYPHKRPSALKIKEAAAYYMSHGVWPALEAPSNVSGQSFDASSGRTTSVFSSPTPAPAVTQHSSSDSNKTVVTSGSYEGTVKSHIENGNSSFQTHHSKSQGRTLMLTGIAAAVLLVGSAVGWIFYKNSLREKEIDKIKNTATQWMATERFKEAYMLADSMLAESSMNYRDFFQNLRQQALDSMAVHFKKSFTLYRLSTLMNERSERDRHLRDMLRFTIDRDSIEKYQKLLAEQLPPVDQSPTLTAPEQLFAEKKPTPDSASQRRQSPVTRVSSSAGVSAGVSPSANTNSAPASTSPQSDVFTFFEGGTSITAVKIGRLYWMLSNSTPTVMRNNFAIRQISDPDEWASTLAPAYYLYNGVYLYNGISTQNAKICPQGWRIPTQAEWESLIKSFASAPGTILDRKKFGLQTVGYRGNDGKMREIGYGFYWVAGSASPNAAGQYGISISLSGNIIQYDFEKLMGDFGHTGFQCRCVKEI